MSQSATKFVLTEEEQQKALAWLNANDVGKCPTCNSSQLEANPTLACLPTANTKGVVSLGEIFPCVVVTCAKCGRMQFFSAMTIGLMTKTEEGES